MNRQKIIVGIGMLGASLLAPAQDVASQAASSDAIERGRTYYAAYKCYACHGWAGQTGTARRLVPMQWPAEAFVAYVQNSPIPSMPSYPDVPSTVLADVYQYVVSLPLDAPPLDDIPLLKETVQRLKATPRAQ